MIWLKTLPDGTEAFVEDAYLPSEGYRQKREYLVLVRENKDALPSNAICKINEQGEPVVWYSHHTMMTREEWIVFFDDLTQALVVDQVMNV